ncbi:hypothetical protein M426DRAFT_127692 [Hypoxylon sp. CI-4A]|nr:hypothetical protein M426DRAFT_127692 [Hypoxylon sp. CI-4A]
MMYSLPAFVLTGWSLLAAVTVAKPISDVVVARRDVQLSTPRYAPMPKRSFSMVKRDANTTFDMGFEAKDLTLFNGNWKALGQDFSLSLSCVECKTTGALVASAEFPDDLEELLSDVSDLNPLNDASLSVGFQGVGALVQLGVTTKGSGQFTLPLFTSESPLGVAGPGFQVGIVFSVDLVLGITGEITTEAGFEVSIPDGSSFTIPLDPGTPNVAKFDGASASLLPLTANAPANVTVALRLRVQAGLDLPSSPLLDAQALAGAYINIPEVIIGEQFSLPPADGSGNCVLPATAEININAGVFVDIGADVGDIQLADFNPTLSTTLFSAAASTCFITAGQATSALPALGTGTGGGGSIATGTAACPVPLVTETKTTTSTYAITSCAAPIANCPASLTQVIQVTEPATITSTKCPVNATITAAPYGNSTTSAAGSGITGGGGGGASIPLTSLSTPVTNTLTVDPSISAPDVPSITGEPQATATASATVTETPEADEGAAVGDVTTYYVTVTPSTCACVPSAAMLR